MHAQLITDRRLWNTFIASARFGHICQTYEWPEHVSAEARRGSLRVGVLDGGCLVAAAALVRSTTSGIDAPFYYAPCGPVCAEPRSPALPALVKFAQREAGLRGAFMIRVEPNVYGDEVGEWVCALKALGLRQTHHSLYPRSAWVTDLRPGEDALLANMRKAWRYGIRAGTRRGLVLRRGFGEDDLDTFYRLMVETGQRAGFHVYPRELYRHMLQDYSEERAERDATAHMALFLAEYQGFPVAAATVAVHGRCAWYMHGASTGLPDYRKLDASRPLLWECIRWARQQGAEEFDWRTIPDAPEPGSEMYGIYEFKRGFGGAARQSVPTHDLILRPAIYWPYIAMVSLHRQLHRLAY
ncbi:MAG TPA: peptidoglycan bridge formation glycyltransferase FemA/FemB family protein [Ktedonobacterales bacterium]|nr:peptidoglycan bridge formation glycyltransferase FemA/FemB family protein [Ktedonobacterales bacterium]